MNISAIVIVGFSAIGLIAAPSGADQKTPELDAFKACVKIKDNTERLACFDKTAARFDFEKASSSLKEAEKLKAEVEKRRRDDLARAKAEQQRQAELEKKKAEEFGKPDAEVQTDDSGVFEILKVKKTRLSTFVMLTNNQVWEITEDKRIGLLKPGRKVIIKKGFLGSFRMTLEESGKTANVKRVF